MAASSAEYSVFECFGDPQPATAEVEAKEVEAFLDPADEGLVGVLL